MLFPPIHPTPRREAALDCQERPPQALDTGKRARQVQRVFLYSLRSFGQATVWIGPKADEEDLMLDEHRQEFGIDLTQDAPGFGAARLVHAAMTLPQLEEQLNLPPHAPKDEGLPQRQALDRHIGHKDRPGGQRQPGGPDLAAFIAGRLPQAPPAIGNVLRDTHGQQPRGKTLALTQRDSHLDSIRRLGLQQCQELLARSGGVVHGGLYLQPGEPAHLLLRQRGKRLQTPVAQVSQPQGSGWWRTGEARRTIRGAALLELDIKASGTHLQAGLELQGRAGARRRAPTTAVPLGCEDLRQDDGGAILHIDRCKPLQQGNGNRLRRDHPGDGSQEDLVQAGCSRRCKALIQGLGAHLDAQSGCCLGEFFQGGLGISEKPKHQGLAERGTAQRRGALDKARRPPRFRRCRCQNLTHSTGHLWYGRHREAPCLQALWWVSQPYNAIGASWMCLA